MHHPQFSIQSRSPQSRDRKRYAAKGPDMALVSDGMPCAICRKPIADVNPGNIFATTFYGIEHPLYRALDDSAVHKECIANWEHRDAFVAFYNSKCRNELRVDRHGHVVRRISLSDLLLKVSLAFPAYFVLVPIFGWSHLHRRTRTGAALASCLPIIVTAAITLLIARFFGRIPAVATALVTWLLFYWSGSRLIKIERT